MLLVIILLCCCGCCIARKCRRCRKPKPKAKAKVKKAHLLDPDLEKQESKEVELVRPAAPANSLMKAEHQRLPQDDVDDWPSEKPTAAAPLVRHRNEAKAQDKHARAPASAEDSDDDDDDLQSEDSGFVQPSPVVLNAIILRRAHEVAEAARATLRQHDRTAASEDPALVAAAQQTLRAQLGEVDESRATVRRHVEDLQKLAKS